MRGGEYLCHMVNMWEFKILQHKIGNFWCVLAIWLHNNCVLGHWKLKLSSSVKSFENTTWKMQLENALRSLSCNSLFKLSSYPPPQCSAGDESERWMVIICDSVCVCGYVTTRSYKFLNLNTLHANLTLSQSANLYQLQSFLYLISYFIFCITYNFPNIEEKLAQFEKGFLNILYYLYWGSLL